MTGDDLTQRSLQKRFRAERRFKAYAITALVLAMSFLVLFIADMVRKGSSALFQAQIKVEASFSEAVLDNPLKALDEEVRFLVSRGWVRRLPRYLEEHPELLGTTATRWVVAEDDVDQYLKGNYARLGSDQLATIERLREEGRLELRFNYGFFTNGDSKLPEIAGIKAAVLGSVSVLLLTLAVSFPIGVMTALYLEEFAPDNRFTQALEVNINNLAAVPSIIFGLLGLAIFINFFGAPRSSVLVGGLTLGVMTLPVIIISSRAALRSVPNSIKLAAFGVGASRWQVVWHHVLPLSLPGILTGTIIGLAQAMGETAPLLIIGMMAYIPETPGGITDAATVLPAQIFTWSGESLRAYGERTAAAILVLLLVLLLLNTTAVWLRRRSERKW